LDQHGHLAERIVDTLLIALCEDIGTPIVGGGICNTLQNLMMKLNINFDYNNLQKNTCSYRNFYRWLSWYWMMLLG
jgi:hypothetical protein